MQRTFAIASLILAWICANGAVWDAVQVFAWARMFAGYSHTLPARAALRETFDPGKPCAICLAVAKAKEAEQKQAPRPLERSTAKLVLACETQEKTQIVPLPQQDWSHLFGALKDSFPDDIDYEAADRAMDEIWDEWFESLE